MRTRTVRGADSVARLLAPNSRPRVLANWLSPITETRIWFVAANQYPVRKPRKLV